MSEYKGIKGFQVQTRTEDPVPYAQALADNPYVGAWSSGGNLNCKEIRCSAAGTSNCSFHGWFREVSNLQVHEEYNGTSWTETNDLNTARRMLMDAGTTTAGLAGGGNVPPSWSNVESWNGSSWTEVN